MWNELLDDPVARACFGLDQAPPVDEREFVWVDLEYVDERRGSVTQRECQYCGDAVDLLEPHPHAVLWAEASINRIMYKPDFCDRECWLAWLGGEEEDEA